MCWENSHSDVHSDKHKLTETGLLLQPSMACEMRKFNITLQHYWLPPSEGFYFWFYLKVLATDLGIRVHTILSLILTFFAFVLVILGL